MAQQDLTITLRADVRPFMKSMRKVRRTMWWTFNGPAVAILGCFVAVGVLGYLLGFSAR